MVSTIKFLFKERHPFIKIQGSRTIVTYFIFSILAQMGGRVVGSIESVSFSRGV